MGGKVSIPPPLIITQSSWKYIGSQNGTLLFEHTESQNQGQLRIISLNQHSQIDLELEIYEYRNHQSALVQCLGVGLEEVQEKLLSRPQRNFKVIIERMSAKWKDIQPQPLQECFYALKQSLQGFFDLWEKAGSFKITNKMIGINYKGEVKVWLNQNFALNHSIFQKPALEKTATLDLVPVISNTSQLTMVQEIVTLVGEKCESKNFPLQYYKKKTFEEALELTHSFIHKYKIELKTHIPLQKPVVRNTPSISLLSASSRSSRSKYQNEETKLFSPFSQ